jgi:hypothetical protein
MTARSKFTFGLTALAGVVVAFTLMRRGVDTPPIWQHGGRLVIENQSQTAWENVSVTVNAYYRGVAPRVAPGGRLEAPLASFVTGLGQRFDTAREHVSRVEVRATDSAGNPVALDWDEQTGPPLVQEAK